MFEKLKNLEGGGAQKHIQIIRKAAQITQKCNSLTIQRLKFMSTVTKPQVKFYTSKGTEQKQ